MYEISYGYKLSELETKVLFVERENIELKIRLQNK